MSNNRNNRYNKKTKTSPQTKTSSQTRTSLLVNDEDISSGEIFSQRKDEDSSSSERVSQRKEGTAQAAARRASEEAARRSREETARRAREEAARRSREEAARRSREEAARRGEGAGIGVPAGYDSSAELIRAREEMAERIRAREEMAKRIIGREEEAAKLAAEINADIQAGVVETTRMQQFRSIRGDTVICVARKFPLWALKFLLRSINYFLIAVNKPKSDVTKAIWDSTKGAIKRFLNYVHDQVVSATASATDQETMELFGRIKDNLKIEDSSLTMSICDNGLTLAKVIKDLFIEGIISVSSDAYYNFIFILESLDTKAHQMSEEEQSTALLLLTLGVNSDEAARVAAETARVEAEEEEVAAMAAEDYTQEEIREDEEEAESQGSGYDTQKEGGKRHTRKHKKQNKSRKQMKHKKTKRHRKKTKKHLKKRNNKKQRKTRNRK